MLNNGGFVPCVPEVARYSHDVDDWWHGVVYQERDEQDGIVEVGSAASNVVGRGRGARLAHPVASLPVMPFQALSCSRARSASERRHSGAGGSSSQRRPPTAWCRAARRSRRRDYSFTGIGDLLEPVIAEATAALPEPQRRALRVALLLEEGEGPPFDPRGCSHSRSSVRSAPFHPTDP